MRRGLLLTGAAMAAVCVLLVAVLAPAIARQAGGLPLFDLRPQGYTGVEALAFFDLLSPAGRSLYLTGWFPADIAFLLLLSAFFGLCYAVLLPGREPLLRAILVTLPLLYGTVDAMENLMIFAAMRYGPAQLQDGVMAFASFLTRTKFAVFTLCVLVLAAPLLHRLVQRLAVRAGTR